MSHYAWLEKPGFTTSTHPYQTDVAGANRGIFGSGALQNERSYYLGKARQSVLEPESRPFLAMAAEIADFGAEWCDAR